MVKFKIEHDRPVCIACGACAAVDPEHWEMNTSDGKSDIKGCDHSGEKQYLDVNDTQGNKDAADSCPVNCIHIYDERGNKII